MHIQAVEVSQEFEEAAPEFCQQVSAVKVCSDYKSEAACIVFHQMYPPAIITLHTKPATRMSLAMSVSYTESVEVFRLP